MLLVSDIIKTGSMCCLDWMTKWFKRRHSNGFAIHLTSKPQHTCNINITHTHSHANVFTNTYTLFVPRNIFTSSSTIFQYKPKFVPQTKQTTEQSKTLYMKHINDRTWLGHWWWWCCCWDVCKNHRHQIKSAQHIWHIQCFCVVGFWFRLGRKCVRF